MTTRTMTRLAAATLVSGLILGGTATAGSSSSLFNHPVLVEGELDFDGDGLVGAAEDMDGPDQVFGTINEALSANNTGANQNGLVLIVTSGRFPESVLVSGANGNVQIEAAPGVEALIDAVRAGLAGNVERQNMPGIVVDAPSNRRVVLRRLQIRNWLDGIRVLGMSRVVIEDCTVDQNLNYGIRAQGSCHVTIDDCSVTGTGFRAGAAGNSPTVDPPMPGHGVSIEGMSTAAISHTTVAQNFAAGVRNATFLAEIIGDAVRLGGCNISGNGGNVVGKVARLGPFF